MKMDLKQERISFLGFKSNRLNYCKKKGQEFNFDLTFEQWLKVWVDSGKMDQRGRKAHEYCMSRKDRYKPYTYENMIIVVRRQLCAENTKGRFTGVPKSEKQKQKMREAKLGVKKSDEHKTAMSAAHTARAKKLHAIQAEHGCSWQEACRIKRETEGA